MRRGRVRADALSAGGSLAAQEYCPLEVIVVDDESSDATAEAARTALEELMQGHPAPNPDVRIALAPGVTCFEANKEYEHGGVSPQECIVPRLAVRAVRTVRHALITCGIRWHI